MLKILSSILFFVLLLAQNLFAQNQNAQPKVYAVIVGISNYQNAGIPKLDYAHKDAEVFATYLKSHAGGAVPDENIVFLENEKATYTAIYNAMDWLIETCKEGDLVYFYFSGHGDMENNTIYKLGFLITYNTPRTNYINNAVRIEDLNNYANTLSVKTKARVVLITDACHSGNLAGNESRGNFLVGEQLKTVLNNEIRISSCAPHELSVEDKKWGGGRGVFSYYLVNGLTGLADDKRDGKISVKEISDYLQKAMNNDQILKEKKHTQTPVIKGKNDFALATIDNKSLDVLQSNLGVNAVSNPMPLPPLPKSTMALFFSDLDDISIEEYIDYKSLTNLTPKEIAVRFIKYGGEYSFSSDSNSPPVHPDTTIYTELIRQVESNPDALKRFNKKLVEAISNRGQEIINLYLSGDEEEIERRRYYNTVNNDYSVYATMFDIALKLSEPNTPLAKILKIKYHYFSAVSLRLKMYKTNNLDSLINLALAEQMKALALEENAAYIYNDLGVLHNIKEDRISAEKYFLKATDIAPQWVIPWSNLVNVYNATDRLDKALQMAAKADSLQKNFHGNMVNTGMIYEKKNNFLFAEELHRKSIKLNTRHYLPFERLGYVYTNTTNYFLADSFFHEAELRKLGFNNIKWFVSPNDASVFAPPFPPPPPCDIPEKINDNDVMTYFVKGKQLLGLDNKLAEASFKKVIAIDPKNPLAFQYMGKMMWQQQRWQEADVYLNYAIQYYLPENEFNKYCDSVKKFITTKGECIYDRFKGSYYHRLEDYFLLGDAYEKWNHFSDAENLYQRIIRIDSMYAGGYYKLWNLMENLKRYHDAEMVLNKYRPKFEDGLEQLNVFYKRVTTQFPASAEWFYKAGNFHYFESVLNAESYKGDIYDNNNDVDVSGYAKDVLGTLDLEDTDMPRSLFTIQIHGTAEYTKPGYIVQQPKRKSILYLLKADSLLDNIDLLADVNAKIGDMYVALNSTANAFIYYQKSSSLQGFNAGTRLKLIDTWDINYYFRDAKKQLDTLWIRDEINFAKLLLLAKYRIHSGEFAEVDSILSRAKEIHPYYIPSIDDLCGRNYFMSKKFNQAIPYYSSYLKAFPNDAATMYSMAKIYYNDGKINECYDWLQKSINAGFNCYWVLLYDTIWDKERTTPKWKTMTANIHHKPLVAHQENPPTPDKH